MTCCVECFSSKDVHKLVQRLGSAAGGPCDYCAGTTGPFVEVDELSRIFRRLVGREYCLVSELTQSADIDPVEEGEFLHELVEGNFAIFATDNYKDLLFDILNAEIHDPGSDQYYEPDELYASREDDALHWPLESYWSSLERVVRQYGHSYRRARGLASGFHSVDDLCGVLQEQLLDIKASLSTDTIFWRARRGAGHTGKALGAPPPHLVTAGRGNLQGQPVLYLCGERTTTIHEVRPSLEDTVSVARFQLTRPVSICDLRSNLSFSSPFVESEEEFQEYRKALDRNEGKQILGRALSKPVRRDDEARDYLPTQVLVQLIAEAGFDGVAYASSQAPGGSNFLFFDPEIATQAAEAENVQVTAVSYVF